MGVVKANAYGHGIVRVAQELIENGVEMLGVAFVEEGLTLRQAGITAPILVLGGLVGDQVTQFLENDLMITCSSMLKLQLIEKAATALGRRAKVHIKIDTGMERLGIHHYNAAELFAAVMASQHCDLCGVFSHFATSDNADRTFAELQLQRFIDATQWFPQNGLPMPPRHMANSGAILQHPNAIFDIVRPGLILYGLYPSADVQRSIALRPVMSLKTRVVYFKVVPQGGRIGYEGTWTAPEQTRVVTLPVGYADGYRRRLSNRGQVLIRGKKYPVVGIVSMDQITVNIGWDEAYNDDEAVLLGWQGDEVITAEDMAAWIETISYEVLTGVSARVPRVYVKKPVE